MAEMRQRSRKDHAKLLMGHVSALLERNSCGKDECWIQCIDGNIPIPLILIVSVSPLCRRAVSDLGVLDKQIVFVLPHIQVGEFLLFLKYVLSGDTTRFYNNEDIQTLRKIGSCLELAFEFCNTNYQITHAKKIIGKIRLKTAALIHQKENLEQNIGGPGPPQAKIPKLASTQSASQRVTLPPTRTVLPQTAIAPTNKFKLQSTGVKKVMIANSKQILSPTPQTIPSSNAPKSSTISSVSLPQEDNGEVQTTSENSLEIPKEGTTTVKQINDCPFCKDPVDKTLMLKHLKTFHPEMDHACMECQDILPNRTELEEHIQDHPYSGWFHTCTSCKFVALTLYQLKVHRKSHFLEEKGYQLSCKFCNKVFIKSAALKKHEELHKNGKLVKTFKCPNCPKIFSKPFNLARHIRSHYGIKSYSCDMCNADFVDSTRLKEHKWIHLQHSRFRCPLTDCAKEFKHRSNLRIHMTQDHEGAMLDGDSVQCNQCNKKFAFQYKLRNHLRWHQMEEDMKKKEKTEESVTEFKDSSVYVCASCKREFKTIDDLGVHCKEYHKAEDKSTNDIDENQPKLSTINVQDVTIENVNILPNNVSVVNCTVTPMDSSLSDLAVRLPVPVNLPSAAQTEQTTADIIGSHLVSDNVAQDVTVNSQVPLEGQEQLEVIPGSIFSNLESHSSQQDGNMPVLYTGYKATDYKDSSGKSVELDAETKQHLQTLDNIRLENLGDKTSQRLELLNDIISKEMNESELINNQLRLPSSADNMLHLNVEDEFDDL